MAVKAAVAFPLLAAGFSTELHYSPRTCQFCQECQQRVEMSPSEVKMKLVDEVWIVRKKSRQEWC